MLFNSISYVLFFIVVVPAFYFTPFKWRWLLLLAASCYFYMVYIPVYILILALTICIDYTVGLFLEKTTGRSKKLLLVISIISNIGILCFFKYYNFFGDNITAILKLTGYRGQIPKLSLLLPVGLSFHTFQSLSYIIEVYRGNQKAERHFGIYALYVMFFPQLVAGPIERPQNIIYQFYEKKSFDINNISSGLKLILLGVFKKLVVADRAAIYVNMVYHNPSAHNGKTLAVATLLFAFQIYGDFSGYSDIAIGSARVMGYKLVTNFNQPYLARNVNEFWKRWHISLTSWFKDYVYIPMGGNRVALPLAYFNIFFVFMISGLWHGASWNFIIWGALNGLLLIILRVTRKMWPIFYRITFLDRLPGIKIPLQIVLTIIFVSITWIFFRADSLNNAVFILKRIFLFDGRVEHSDYMLEYCVIGITALILFEIKTEYLKDKLSLFDDLNYLLKGFFYAAFVIGVLLLGVFDGGQFIYFQF